MNPIGNFKTKISLVFIISLLFVGALSNFLIYRFALNTQFNDMREKLKVIAQTAALSVDADELKKVPLNPDGVNSPHFKAIAEKLSKIKEVNPPIKYIYTMTKTGREGIWQFVVDVDAFHKTDRNKKSYPGEEYDASRFSELLKAFDAPSADKKLERDEWGSTLSGYAPIKDKSGKSTAILGVDILADNVYLMRKETHKRALFVLFVAIGLSVLIGLFFSRQISEPIKKLVEGTRNIGDGNLEYKINISSRDEIGELARAFNKMTDNLSDSRKRMLNYFYRVVQSLARIMEARDHYTRGHSERVAHYAEKIAVRMNLPKENIELLRETTLLHDIGKLGIKESILNKNGELNGDEWEIVRKHPEIGENILKPLLVPDEMLKIIRGHHERCDGKGYPDGISSENINLFTAIGSVADAYDAMTSERAYRPALTISQAIDELKKNRGTQFDPAVVDAFLQVLQDES